MRPLAVALVLVAATACGGEAPGGKPTSGIEGELQLLSLNRLEGYAEAIPCDPPALPPLAAASSLRDELVAGGATSMLVVTGDSLVPTDSSTTFAPVGVALRARGQVILEALAAARLDAWVPGRTDLDANPHGLLDRAGALGVPTVISNLAEGVRPDIARTLVRQVGSLKIGFVGLVPPREPGAATAPAEDEAGADDGGADDENPRGDLELTPPGEAARRLAAALRDEQGVHLVVALSALRPTMNVNLAESGAVDLIVGGTDTGLEAGRIVIVGKAALLSTLPAGREVGHTRLRVAGGNLQMSDLSALRTLPAETARLEQELAVVVEQAGTSDLQALARRFMPGHEEDFVRRYSRIEENRAFLARHEGFAGSSIRHWPAELTAPPADHPVTVALGRQGEAIEEKFAHWKRPLPAPPEGTPVIPVPEDCRSCHANQVRFWEQTPHARAWADLAERKRGRDPTCLGCHTAGFNQEEGWFDPRLDAPRGPVTCYSCHQATAVHSSSRVYVLDSTQLVTHGEFMDCARCHDLRRSPGFDQKQALPAVSCPPMRDDEPAIVLARERAVEALEARAARGEAEPLDDYLLGRGLVGLGRHDEGFPVLRGSSRTNADNPRQAIETARLFDEHSRSGEGLEVLRDYLAGKTGDPDVNHEHVRLMLEARDPGARNPAEALSLLELLLSSADPEDARLLDFKLLQVDALARLGRGREAAELLRSLGMQHPEHPGVLERMRHLVPVPR